MENLLREAILTSLDVNECGNICEFLRSPRKKVFFGQGRQAIVCYELCRELGVEVDAFIGNNESDRYQHLPKDIEFFAPGKFPYKKDDYDVLLAINEEYYADVMGQLKIHNFKNIFYANNWKMVNYLYKRAFLKVFLELQGIDTGKKIWESEDKGFRIYGIIGQSKEYITELVLSGGFFDVVAPSIFGCSRYFREGAYELDMVQIEKEDIVLDLGANIGMFSCVAATKGRHVYAFEPTPGTRKLLEQNAELYHNFDVIEYAASNEDGDAMFTINDMSTENAEIGRNTLFGDILDKTFNTCQIKVKTKKIDTFMKENHIAKVDFIKADIEGAERYMLMGAQETLRISAPKLSLCTYHLPDDREVMTELILKANPDYKIIYKEYKLYAYVPDDRKRK